ncbi:MAG: putative transport system permease protein, partial [Rhodospirillaceae bacterium]|nr:putative transport system permease protein [Rhodospirillaceae bacterium]
AGRDIVGPDDFTVEVGWARDHGLKVGDAVTMALPAGRRTTRVTGVFRFARSVNFGDIGFVAEPLAAAQRDLGQPGQVSQIYVRALDRAQVSELQSRVQTALGPGLEVRTPSAEIANLSDQLQGLNVFLLFFAGVALFVGAFLIFNAFNVTVIQRTRELGMLRTLGATRAATIRLVLAEAVLLGIVGSAVGLLAGVGLAVGLIALMSSVFVGVPFGSLTIPAGALIYGTIVGTLVTAAAALWPAVRAGRTSPLQAMRQRAERIGGAPWRPAVAGLVVLAASIPGVGIFASGDHLSTGETVYGVAGIIGVFLGVALLAPILVRPLVRVLSVPLRVFGRTEGRLAADNAARAPGRTALTASAVMVGLALVITFSGFSASAVSAVRDSIDRSLASDFIVVPRNIFASQGFSPELARQIAALPDAGDVSAVRFGYATIDGKATELIGVDPASYGRISETRLDGDGTPDWSALAGPAAYVTHNYAADEGLGAGDTIAIATPSAGVDRLRVAGVVDDRVESQSGRGVFVSTARAERDAGLTQDLRVYVQARDPSSRQALRAEVERVLERFPSAKVLSNAELKDEIESAFSQVFSFLYALLGVAIFASAFGIVNTLAMSVLERRREIGMIRAVGGTRSQVRRMIRRESVLVTLVGVILGLVVGLVLAYAFVRSAASSFPGLRFVMPWQTIVIVVAGALVVAVLAAALPARRAARMNVITAVAYE